MDGSPSSVLSVGFGSWGSTGLVLTLGFGISTAIVVSGPYRWAAIDAHLAGAAAIGTHMPGSAEIDSHLPGAAATAGL